MELYLFSGPGENPLLRELMAFRQKSDRDAYFRAARALLRFAGEGACCQNLLREVAVSALLDSPGAAAACEAPTFEAYFRHDIERFYDLFFASDWDGQCKKEGLLPLPQGQDSGGEGFAAVLRELVASSSADALAGKVREFFAHYTDLGEARYNAFRWEEGVLAPIGRADPLAFEDLAGLEHQKDALMRNAQAFLKGLPAHDVLLSGGSGTGKSSCVKATLTAYAGEGLRVVELPKQAIGELPALLDVLSHKRCKYIVYIDDLSFEEVDEGYKELKVALDGRVEERLANVLIYATSNRRHLVRETWKERDWDEEIHENDSVHEKKSLSERFGLHLTFPLLTQKEYFAIVDLHLRRNGFALTDEIAAQASAWALTYHGRSGRTAKQFVADWVTRSGDC